MSPALLARIQFAFTAGFHFLFPPLTIGMAWIVFALMNRWKRTDAPEDKAAARFWFGLFSVSFAVGVATGITMEFQFGTNWAEYSRFVGDIFGAPLAAEALFSFFLESTFMGVLIFGWNRVSKKTLWFSSLMVAVGSTLSALWIIIANSWMQTPAGYTMRNGRAELTDFFAAALNPSTLPRYTHVIAVSLLTGAFFVMGISAWYLLKKKHVAFASRSFKTGLAIGAVASVLVLGFGHWHGVQVAHTQPTKLAAIEGLFQTEKPAPGIIFAIPDVKNKVSRFAIQVPALLSFLIYGQFDAEVRGLTAYPEEEWPPVLLTFSTFHTMVGLGMLFILLMFVGLFLWWRGTLENTTWYLRAMMLALPLPFLASQVGWITAEVGRQPWAVYKVIKTVDAISFSVPAGQILISLILFLAVYATLFALWVFLLRHKIQHGPDEA